jgi:hypothetical protein
MYNDVLRYINKKEILMPRIKCFARFSEDEKSKYTSSRCLFTISVGQQTHENEHFMSTVQFINQNFKESIMLVDDSLQRHTIAIERCLNPEEYYDISIQEGNLWLKRNKCHYEQLTNLKQIIRWDTWLNHPNFSAQKEKIIALMASSPAYHQAFEDSADEYIAKLKKRTGAKTFDAKRAKRLSIDFIIEECTALCLWAELQCHYEVYPNKHNAAINATRDIFVRQLNPSLLKPVTLGFRNAPQLKPQTFMTLMPAMQLN